jgi:hypothetical protein
MAYSEVDRAYIRTYLGYGAIFLQAEPRLENAITATQSVADKGARPDSTTENIIRAIVYGSQAVAGSVSGLLPIISGDNQSSGGVTTFAVPATLGLLAVDAQLSQMWQFSFALKADGGDAEIDTFRASVQLRGEGRRLANRLAKMLGMRGVRADVFSPGTPVLDDDPFTNSNLEHWRGGP